MQDSTLLKVSIAVSLVGLTVLFLILSLTENIRVDIASIEEIDEGESIKVIGKIVDQKDIRSENGYITIIKIMQESMVDVIVFDNISVEKGERVEVDGELRYYKGSEEIIASNIRDR